MKAALRNRLRRLEKEQSAWERARGGSHAELMRDLVLTLIMNEGRFRGEAAYDPAAMDAVYRQLIGDRQEDVAWLLDLLARSRAARDAASAGGPAPAERPPDPPPDPQPPPEQPTPDIAPLFGW